jgi:hypothetical protein
MVYGSPIHEMRPEFSLARAPAYTKTTSAWAVGSGNGALDTGTIADSTCIILIKRLDTGVVGPLISLLATAPTLPANYTLFRHIGSRKTNGSGEWVKVMQLGDECLRDTRITGSSCTTTVTSPDESDQAPAAGSFT